MKLSSRVMILCSMLGASVLPISAPSFAEHSSIRIVDHRPDYASASRLAYRLASLAERLSYGYRLSSEVNLTAANVSESIELGDLAHRQVMITDHSGDVYLLADRLHQSASNLYYALRNSRIRMNSLMYDHRDDQIMDSLSEVRRDYYALKGVASYWEIGRIAQVFRQLNYALTGGYGY